MRAARVLTIALLLALATLGSPVFAEPITDPASLNTSNPYDTSLTDGTGLPFLLTGAPTYLFLPGGNSAGGDEGGGAGPDGTDGVNPFGDPFLSSFFADPGGPTGTDSNSSGDPSDSDALGDDTTGVFDGLGPDEDPEGGIAPDNNPRIVFEDVQNPRLPEPATMLLVGAGLTAAVVRRRIHANRTV
jgi:hypothetical protein